MGLTAGIPSILILTLLSLSVTESVRNNGPTGGFGEPPLDNCRRKAKDSCQEMQFTTCFGVKLPYGLTSNELVNENFTQHQIQNEMKRWEVLRNVPRCWAVIQPLLCSFYMPKCGEDGFIELPPQELCRIAKNPCRVIEKELLDWPDFLKCEDYSKFPTGCKSNDIRELRFNTSATCLPPLIEVQSEFNYYKEFDGCAFNGSTDPLFTKEEHVTVSAIIKYFGMLCLGCQCIFLTTFLINWKSGKKYPAVVLFWTNICYFIGTLGWMAQFLPNTKEAIVCRKDATIRRNEPGPGENPFCIFGFALIYFGTIKALAWLTVFSYVFYLTCISVGRIQNKIDKQKLYFHVFAWLVPVVLTIVCISVGKVDGSSIAGICFIGIEDPTTRISLVILPVVVLCLATFINFWRGIYDLIRITMSASDFLPKGGRSEIKSQAFRIGLFSLGLATVLAISLISQFQLMKQNPVWEESLKKYMYCKLNLRTNVDECEITEKADVSLVIWNVVAYFLCGLLMCSLIVNKNAFKNWTRYLKRICCSADSDSANINKPKHRLIKQAFEKRHQYSQKGRLSLTLQGTDEDPIGLNRLLDPTKLCKNQDLDDQSQQMNPSQTGTDADEVNSEWAAALPHLLNRRGALVPPHSSNSVSCVSEDSRRPSFDSVMSEVAARNLQGSNYERGTHKKSRRDFFRMSKPRRSWFAKNSGSSTSLESNGGSQQILSAITKLIDKKLANGEGSQLGMAQNNFQTATKRTTMVTHLGVQTSFENIASTHCSAKQTNLTMSDKATQSSLVSLHEIGTQTKKSATKKEKEKKDKSKKDTKETEHHEDAKGHSEGAEDPVLKLLSPV